MVATRNTTSLFRTTRQTGVFTIVAASSSGEQQESATAAVEDMNNAAAATEIQEEVASFADEVVSSTAEAVQNEVLPQTPISSTVHPSTTPTTTTPSTATTTTATTQEASVAEPLSPSPATTASAVAVISSFFDANPVAAWSLGGIAAFLGVTFVIAVGRTATKRFSSQGKRSRTVNKNKLVVDEISKYLPNNRSGLSGTVVISIRALTGFSPVELFRKYLWFLLRERKFDQEAVDDVIALKGALKLSDVQVAEALRERANRVYDKYGAVMLDSSGMSASGVERKATARALFSKMQFLVECEALLSSDAAAGVNLRDVFGATEDDAARLRIASLYEVDLEDAFSQKDAVEEE